MKEISTLRKNIRIHRQNKNLSRKRLAKKAGISVFALVDVELGRSKNPKFGTILKLSKALEVSIDRLLVPSK